MLNCSEVSRCFSKLESAVTHRHSKLQDVNEKAEHMKETTSHIETWLTEREKKCTELKYRVYDQTTLSDAKVSSNVLLLWFVRGLGATCVNK